jgi:HlyD family secretion protein
MKVPRLLSSRYLGLALLALLLAGALVFVALRTGPLAPTRVTVQKVAAGALEPALFGIGTVEARRSVAIGPTAAARVRRVAVDVGDAVTAGQLLAEMDPIDLDERVAAVEASIARAQSAAAAADAQRADAQARRALAAANAQRNEALGAQEFISAFAVESRRQELASAEAGVASAQANAAAARQEFKRLAAERAALQRQRENLRLVAPSAGVVTARDAEAGSTLVAGQSVLRLVDPATLWVRVRLDQGRSAGLAVGLPAQIALRSDPERLLPGRVARVETVSDSVTEERIAQVAFEQVPPGVSIGELAEVTLALPRHAQALLLPNASIKRRGDATGVWRRNGSALRFAPVRLGAASLDGRVQVLEGLSAGDEVIVHSETDLSDHSRIKVVASLAGAATNANAATP